MIGLYGGTFNPIHIGHLRAARDVTRALDLERVIFIPNATPPHKPSGPAGASPDALIAPPENRFAWVEAAVRDEPGFEVSRIEIDRDGPSFLVDTLSALTAGRPGDFAFIVGQDAFCEMGSWREPRQIFASCHIVVTTRPPILEGHLASWLPEVVRDDFEISDDGRSATHRRVETTIQLVTITATDISASQLRADLAAQRDVSSWLPEPCRDAILASRCYNPDPADAPQSRLATTPASDPRCQETSQ
jgi:nicotinate-nucleotide adenylyltransferase